MSHVGARYLTLLCNFLSSFNLYIYPADLSGTYQCFDFYESLWILCSSHTDEHALNITTKHKGLFIQSWQTEYRLTALAINFHIILSKVTEARRKKKISCHSVLKNSILDYTSIHLHRVSTTFLIAVSDSIQLYHKCRGFMWRDNFRPAILIDTSRVNTMVTIRNKTKLCLYKLWMLGWEMKNVCDYKYPCTVLVMSELLLRVLLISALQMPQVSVGLYIESHRVLGTQNGHGPPVSNILLSSSWLCLSQRELGKRASV